ncbi:MAG: FAD-dependent oxidoreductase [Lachnospiraceae bacterium]|nr:FAD-dependent oxidoreductase [Lachnospiraceae bacterium]
MGIVIDNIKLTPFEDEKKGLLREAAGRLRISESAIDRLTILRKSVDARKKPDVVLLYQVAVFGAFNERKLLTDRHIKNIRRYEKKVYRIKHKTSDLTPQTSHLGSQTSDLTPQTSHLGSQTSDLTPHTSHLTPLTSRKRPVVVGLGPAGLFAGLILAEEGLSPIIIERGEPGEKRKADVEEFFRTGHLRPDSNVQFGEGGAGAFSDGKLNTGVHDREGRNRFVLETFVKYGAPEEILYDAKPHIGTDRLTGVIGNIRRAIEEKGGEVRFQTRLSRIIIESSHVRGIETEHNGVIDQIETDDLILAIGHSARDTFYQLYSQGVPMQAKEFAVGFRVEHPQDFISRAQYGDQAAEVLPPAPYRLSMNGERRHVYSFCMCPGGYVVNASSEQGLLAVNGMSDYARDSANANSAIVVSVGEGEYDLNDPLGAIKYQRSLEKKAYDLCEGLIPQQLFADFVSDKESSCYGDFESLTKGGHKLTNLRGIFSPDIENAFIEGMNYFDKRIKGFARPDAILSGVESRTSSPVRIPRDSSFQSSIRGLYPCGEGAGYAGGITSAAMDGVRVAESL